jgi:hypothetical protein
VVGLVALAATSAISTVEARAAGDGDRANEIYHSVLATLSTRPTAQIRVNDELRPALAGALPFALGLLVLAFAGVVVASSAVLKLCSTRLAIRRRAPPPLFLIAPAVQSGPAVPYS